LELDLDADAGALLEEFSGDIQALWPYARVLWRFRTEGDTAPTRAALDNALKANAHVVKYLVDPESMPFERPPHFALGSKEEAAYVAESLGDAYEATAGATSWLRERTMNRRLRSRMPKRPARRSSRRS
jgi:hypothetical protein